MLRGRLQCLGQSTNLRLYSSGESELAYTHFCPHRVAGSIDSSQNHAALWLGTGAILGITYDIINVSTATSLIDLFWSKRSDDSGATTCYVPTRICRIERSSASTRCVRQLTNRAPIDHRAAKQPH